MKLARFIEPDFSAGDGLAKDSVRLDGVVAIKDQGGVGIDLQFRVVQAVGAEPELDNAIRLGVMGGIYWRGHEDKSFDKLGFPDAGRSLVAAHEFDYGELIPIFQGGDAGCRRQLPNRSAGGFFEETGHGST